MSAALDRLIAQKATRSGRKPPSRPIEVKVDFIDERSAGHLASLNRAYRVAKRCGGIGRHEDHWHRPTNPLSQIVRRALGFSEAPGRPWENTSLRTGGNT